NQRHDLVGWRGIGDVFVQDVMNGHRLRRDRVRWLDQMRERLAGAAAFGMNVRRRDLDDGVLRRIGAGGLDVADAQERQLTPPAGRWPVRSAASMVWRACASAGMPTSFSKSRIDAGSTSMRPGHRNLARRLPTRACPRLNPFAPPPRPQK